MGKEKLSWRILRGLSRHRSGTNKNICKKKKNAVWNLPAIKVGDPVPELTSFDAQKWRSGLGAYYFGQCTAQKNADGKWSYTVGQEAIS